MPVTVSVHRSAPRDCVVASITFRCCGSVLWMLSGGDDAVVTGRAGAKNLQMVNATNRSPCEGVVAVFTQIRRRNVIDGLAHCGHAVVAGKARASDTGVVEGGRDPRCSSMTIVALVAGWQVVDRFAACLAPVMAADAGAQHLQVVNPLYSSPGIRPVAGAATIRCYHMKRWLRCRTDSTRLRMAAGTLYRRACKQSVRMA